MGGKLGCDHNSEVRRGYIARTRLPPASKHHRFKGNLLPVLIKMVPTGRSAVSIFFSIGKYVYVIIFQICRTDVSNFCFHFQFVELMFPIFASISNL